jgi:ADP-ribose pyrophosphatase YjhB (NUDIX family)
MAPSRQTDLAVETDRSGTVALGDDARRNRREADGFSAAACEEVCQLAVRVQVHGAIWVRDQLVVHRSRRHNRERVTLPGGRVKDRESVTDALVREVREEVDLDVDVGELLFAGEVVNASTLHDVVLVFAATIRSGADTAGLDLVDPASPEAASVLPPVLAELTRYRDTPPDQRRTLWRGNLHASERPRG